MLTLVSMPIHGLFVSAVSDDVAVPPETPVSDTIDVECVSNPSAALNASRSSETFAPGYSRYAMGFASSTVNDGTVDPSVIVCG